MLLSWAVQRWLISVTCSRFWHTQKKACEKLEACLAAIVILGAVQWNKVLTGGNMSHDASSGSHFLKSAFSSDAFAYSVSMHIRCKYARELQAVIKLFHYSSSGPSSLVFGEIPVSSFIQFQFPIPSSFRFGAVQHWWVAIQCNLLLLLNSKRRHKTNWACLPTGSIQCTVCCKQTFISVGKKHLKTITWNFVG